MKDSVKIKVRNLRANQTLCETIIWKVIRNRRFYETKFYRQYPISFDYYGENRHFIADFYCHQKQLIVEIDGGIHETQKVYDKFRDYILTKKKYKVIHFSNGDVLNDLSSIKTMLKEALDIT